MKPSLKLTLFRYPMAFSHSSFVHSKFGQQFQISVEYTQTATPPGALNEAIEKFYKEGGVGANVTMPHKEEAFKLCQQKTLRAELAQSVNTLFWREGVLWGDNTDGVGFIRDVTKNHQLSFKDKVIGIIGAGGAVAGLINVIANEKPKAIWVVNRSLERARALLQRGGQLGVEIKPFSFPEFIAHASIKSVDWLINATPVSAGDLFLSLPSYLAKGIYAYDLSYSKECLETPFIKWSKNNGAFQVMDGLGMLVEQAAKSFEIWSQGCTPGTLPIIQELRANTVLNLVS